MSRPRAILHQVKLNADKDSSGAHRFRPESDLWNEARQEFVFHKDHHGMGKQDYHLVEFVLNDQTGDGLQFPSNPHEAMWIAPVENRSNPQCPNADTISDYSVMEPICVADGRNRLIVRNENPRKEDWSFTLNFAREGRDESDRRMFVSWDPVGSNQNGGVTRE